MTFNERMRDDDDDAGADMRLISSYLSGDMSPSEESALEERMATDPVFFNEMIPLIEFQTELRAEIGRNTKYVPDHTTACIEVGAYVPLTVGRGATAVVVTPVGDVIMKEGSYILKWDPAADAVGGLHIHRMTVAHQQ